MNALSPSVVPPDLADRVLAAVGDAVVGVDRLGRVIFWSGAAQRLFGAPAHEALGRPITKVISDVAPNELEQVMALGGSSRLEAIRRLGRNGAAIAVTSTPLRDEAGEIIGTTALFRPMGGWLDPVERAGRPKRQWHRTLGAIVHDLVREAGDDRSALDTFEELAHVLVGQARRLLPSAECLLAVVPRDRPEIFHVLGGAGPWAERQMGREFTRAGTPAGRTLVESRPVETTRADELHGMPRPREAQGMPVARLVPLLSARPLPDGRQALGVLAFYRATRTYFTPYERLLINEFAKLVSLSLQRAELLRSSDETESRLSTGVDVARELAVSLEPKEVRWRLVRRAATAVDADRVALLQIEGGNAVLADAYDRVGTTRPVSEGERFPLAELRSGEEPIILHAVRDRQPRMSGPYRVRGFAGVTEFGQAKVRHTLTLPLVLGGSVVAVLLVSRERDEPFRQEDTMTLQQVGNVAALALRNAQLFAQAQDASKARSDFLNMAGHELRTPLTVIKGYLSMLADGSLDAPPASLRQPIELLAGKAEELSGLVDDLLFTSKLESGRLPAHSMRLDLGIAVQEAAKRARPRVQLLGGELVMELSRERLVVSADPEHVARVLDNLVNNALTYRRPGQTAWVRLSARAEGGQAIVWVEDRGRGISPEIRDRIFERFVRGEQSSAGTSGTGLGLYISRQLAARHGGSLDLDFSEPGRGSRFALRLPRAAAAS